MQPMDKLINLAALQNYPLRRGNPGCDEVNANPHFLNGIESIIEFAESLPTIDPVRHGYWRAWSGRRPIWLGCFCSVCENYEVSKFAFCPNCGAKMDADAEED